MGIEPTSSAWKAEILPLNYSCITHPFLVAAREYLHRFKWMKKPLDTFLTTAG